MSVKKPSIKFFHILFFLILIPNLLISHFLELTYDESYYWLYSENLAWGYFDHPPLVALMIKIGTILFGESEFAVRFLPNVLLGLSVYLMWLLVEKKNLLVFSLLFFSMPLINFSGVFALPDSALTLSAVFYFWCLKKYITEQTWKSVWILALSIAIMFYAKYHGLLIVLLTVFAYPKFLSQKKFWVIVVLTTIFFLPHMYWQYTHDFVSFKFHLFGRKEKHFSISNILDFVAGQVFLMGFFSFFLMSYKLYRDRSLDLFERILAFNSYGFLVFLFFLSFRNPIEANWTVSCSIALIILMTNKLTGMESQLIKTSIISIFFAVVMRGVLLFPGSLSGYEMDYENRFNEVHGWKEVRLEKIDDYCGELPKIAENYQYAAKLSFYFQERIPGFHIKSRTSQFGLWQWDKVLKDEEQVCFISTKEKKEAMKIETYFKDPVFVSTQYTMGELRALKKKRKERE